MTVDWRSWAALAGFLAATGAAAALGGLFTARSVAGWYQTLVRPSWNPPAAMTGMLNRALFICCLV